MKLTVSIIGFMLCYFFGYTQSVLPFRADTIRLYKQGGNAELLLQNATRNVNGVLVNVGGGATRFMKPAKINDSAIVIGLDTLTVGGGGLGGEVGIAGYGLQKTGTTYSVDTSLFNVDFVYDSTKFTGNATSLLPFRSAYIEPKFPSVALLKSYAPTLATGEFVQTNGYYNAFDGGGARYLIVTDTIAGLPVDTASFIKLTGGGKYARLYHNGTVNVTQFGAKGDNVTNDYLAFKKVNDFARADGNVRRIEGRGLGYTYRLRYRTSYITSTSRDLACFLRLNYSNITWDGNGSKIIYDNKATQSYVQYTNSGVIGIYRCKESHVSTSTPPIKTLYFTVTDWQLMKDGVSAGEAAAYPVWASGVQYYGANRFAMIGFDQDPGPTIPAGHAENVVFRNWEITPGETDSVTFISGYWNGAAQGFVGLENISGFTLDNINLHNVNAEAILLAGFLNCRYMYITRSDIHHNIEAGNTLGNINIIGNHIHHNRTHGWESNPSPMIQLYFDNEVDHNADGITIGAQGSDQNTQGNARVGYNFIHDNERGLNLSRRGRGGHVNNNTFQDNSGQSINLYTSSSGVGYPDAMSEWNISSNHFYAYLVDGDAAIALGMDHNDTLIHTQNIIITENYFGRLANAEIEHVSHHFNALVSIYGDNYKDIIISDNKSTFPETLAPIVRYDGNNGTFKPVLSGNIAAGNTYFDRLMFPSNPERYSIQIGTMNLQSTAKNASYIGHNLWFNGASWQNVASGRSSLLAMTNGELGFYRTEHSELIGNIGFDEVFHIDSFGVFRINSLAGIGTSRVPILAVDGTLSYLGNGTTGQVLTMSSGTQAWMTPSAGGGSVDLTNYARLDTANTFAAVNTFAAKQIVTATGGTTDSKLAIGTIEIQPFGLNNAWIGENIRFNGADFVPRATGAAGLFYFQGEEGQFRFSPSTTANVAVANNVQFKANADGTVAIGGVINTATGNYTGASLVANSSGVTMNAATVGKIKGTGTAPTIAAGAGAGTGPTVGISVGHDLSFRVSITTGSSPDVAGSTIATVTLAAALSGANPLAMDGFQTAAAAGAQFYYEKTSTTITIKAGTALTASTSYIIDLTILDY